MDEASALVAWGRQVLANRRLQRQRERLAREKMQRDIALQHVNSTLALPTTSSCKSSDRGSTSPPHLTTQSMATTSVCDTSDIAHLKRRVEVAKQCVQELQAVERRNLEAFQRRQKELQSMVEESRHHSQPHHHTAELSPSVSPSSSSSLGRQLSHKEQLDELLSLQKAILKSQHDEKLSGAAVVTLTTCAEAVKTWDSRLWQLLREALFAWKLQLLPSLHRFGDIVEKLQLPHPHPQGCSPLLNGKSGSSNDITDSLDTNGDKRNGCETAAGNREWDVVSCNALAKVALPVADNYPALEWIEKLPLEEAIGVAVNALAEAGVESAMSLSSLIGLSDRVDAQLADLLVESAKELELQEGSIAQSRSLLEKLQSERAALEENGTAMDKEVEDLQRMVLSLKLQCVQWQREEKEQAEALQRLHGCVEELKQKIQREAMSRGDALHRADGARQTAKEATQRRRMLLEEELPRVGERQKKLEEEVLQLRHTCNVAKEEETEAAERRRRQIDELRVAQATLEASREELMQRKQLHEQDSTEIVSLQCREQELRSQMVIADEAYDHLFAWIETQRGVEANLREELAGIRSELMEVKREMTELLHALRNTEAQQEEVEATLLYGGELPNANANANANATVARTRGGAGVTNGPTMQRSLGDVVRPGELADGSGAAAAASVPCAPVRNAEREAVEMMSLAPRGLQRSEADGDDGEGLFPVVVVVAAPPADSLPSHHADDDDDDDGHIAPLSVAQPSRRGGVQRRNMGSELHCNTSLSRTARGGLPLNGGPHPK